MNTSGKPRKLRLCYVADLRSLHTQRWVTYFAKRGHSVTVLSPTKMELPGVRVHRILWKSGLPKLLLLVNILPIIIVLRTARPDVLHAHYVRVYGWLAALSFFKPLIITVWGGDVLEDQGAFSDFLGRKLTPFALRRASIVTAQSRFLEQRVIDLGKPEGNVHMVGHGVDRKQFRSGLNSDSLRNELGLGEVPVVLCTRLITRLYNTETIIRAIPLVINEIPAAKFIFSELAGEEPYIQEMKALAKELGVEGSVVFLREIPPGRMPLFLNLARVLVSIPDSDSGMPQTVLEAMSCGTVPIVSSLPQYSELIKSETNALVVPPKDVRALAVAILRLLKDHALREKLSRACLDTVMEGMDYEAEMAKMEGLYHELSRT
ncbi:MAG: glycosyltransferase family 4 protein [Candidatus Eisenbacteria bacterium]|nr:glycosyltransferase family 4 protein [Candidatus Eisenbacteria bacterium]